MTSFKSISRSYGTSIPERFPAPYECIPVGPSYPRGGMLRQLGVEIDGPQGELIKSMVMEIIAIILKAKKKACSASSQEEIAAVISAGFRDLFKFYDRSMNAIALASYPTLVNQATMY